MEIHRYEKIWFVAALLLIVGFIVTIAYGAVGAGVQMVSDDGGTVEPDLQTLNEHERFGNLGVQEINESYYEINMIAIHPNFLTGGEDLRVPAGSTVTFYITSGDVTHGFQLPGTNVNSMVIPGQITKLTVEFDESGEYGYICHEYCGPQHHEMAGTLTVVPEGEWEGDA